MRVNLELTLAHEYFAKEGKEIDYDGDGSAVDMVTVEQAEALQEILTMEASIHILRGVIGLCGSQADVAQGIRRKLLTTYEEKYGKYKIYRDYH